MNDDCLATSVIRTPTECFLAPLSKHGIRTILTLVHLSRVVVRVLVSDVGENRDTNRCGGLSSGGSSAIMQDEDTRKRHVKLKSVQQEHLPNTYATQLWRHARQQPNSQRLSKLHNP